MTNKENIEPWGMWIKEEFLKRLDFLSDHWVKGDDRPPFSFGGWREEIACDFVEITRHIRADALKEGAEKEREKYEAIIKPCLDYCVEQNGLPYCKNCGLGCSLDEEEML